MGPVARPDVAGVTNRISGVRVTAVLGAFATIILWATTTVISKEGLEVGGRDSAAPAARLPVVSEKIMERRLSSAGVPAGRSSSGCRRRLGSSLGGIHPGSPFVKLSSVAYSLLRIAPVEAEPGSARCGCGGSGRLRGLLGVESREQQQQRRTLRSGPARQPTPSCPCAQAPASRRTRLRHRHRGAAAEYEGQMIGGRDWEQKRA